MSDRDRCTGRERAGPPRPFPSLAPGGRPFAPRIALPWLCRCFIFRLGSPPPSSFFGRRFSSDVVALNPPPSRRTRRGPPPPPPPPFADAFGIPNIGLVRQGVVLARVHNQMAWQAGRNRCTDGIVDTAPCCDLIEWSRCFALRPVLLPAAFSLLWRDGAERAESEPPPLLAWPKLIEGPRPALSAALWPTPSRGTRERFTPSGNADEATGFAPAPSAGPPGPFIPATD